MIFPRSKVNVITKQKSRTSTYLYIVYSPVLKYIVHVTLIVDRDEEPPRPAVHEAVLLAGEAHRRRVHYWHHLCHVLADEAIEQVLVTVLNVTRLLLCWKCCSWKDLATSGFSYKFIVSNRIAISKFIPKHLNHTFSMEFFVVI